MISKKSIQIYIKYQSNDNVIICWQSINKINTNSTQNQIEENDYNDEVHENSACVANFKRMDGYKSVMV